MGTHPIFESDFDCLTEWSSLPRSVVLLPALPPRLEPSSWPTRSSLRTPSLLLIAIHQMAFLLASKLFLNGSRPAVVEPSTSALSEGPPSLLITHPLSFPICLSTTPSSPKLCDRTQGSGTNSRPRPLLSESSSRTASRPVLTTRVTQ